MDAPTTVQDGCSYPSAQRAEKLIAVHALVAIIGGLACLVTIVLIGVTKTYRTQIHRLRLYLSVACFLFAVTLGFETLPIDFNKSSGAAISVRQGWNGACTAIGFFAQYFAFSKTFAITWVSIFIFSVATLKKELYKPRYEAAGVLVVFLLPSVFTWIPLVGNTYGLTGTWCWIRSTCNTSSYPLGTPFQLGVSLAPAAILHVFSLLLIVPVIVLFGKGALVRANARYNRERNFNALKETAPLLVYPALYSMLVVADTVYTISLQTGSPQVQFDVTEMIIISLYQLFALALPVSFLLHPSVQRILACPRCKGRGKENTHPDASNKLDTPLISTDKSSS